MITTKTEQGKWDCGIIYKMASEYAEESQRVCLERFHVTAGVASSDSSPVETP